MKRVLLVHRYDDELVDTCTPKPRITRRDSSTQLFREMSHINPVERTRRHIRVECELTISRDFPSGDFKMKSLRAAEPTLVTGQAKQYSWRSTNKINPPTETLARKSPAFDARDATVVDGDRLETVYNTVFDVGRLTESMMALIAKCFELFVVG